MPGPIVVIPVIAFSLACITWALGRLFEFLAGE